MVLFRLIDFSEKQFSEALKKLSNVELVAKIQKLSEELYVWHDKGMPLACPELLDVKSAKAELIEILEKEYEARNLQTTPFRMNQTEHKRGDNVVTLQTVVTR